MSLFGILSSCLASMGFAQLGCAFLAIAAYSLALNGSLAGPSRSIAAGVAVAAAVVFSALTPSWAGGVVLMTIAVLGLALFAAATWLISALFGLDQAHGSALAEGELVVASAVPRRSRNAGSTRPAPLPL